MKRPHSGAAKLLAKVLPLRLKLLNECRRRPHPQIQFLENVVVNQR